MVKRLKEQIKIFPQALIADAGYDYETNLKFIIQNSKAKGGTHYCPQSPLGKV